MTPHRWLFFPLVGLMVLWWSPVSWAAASGSATSAKTKISRQVWLVLFSSRDCPHCERVKELIKSLKTTYPIRVRVFDVDQEEDYKLLRRLEAIHSQEPLSVPLVMVDESILAGETEIAEKLEKTVRTLSRCGGARLPYLGPQKKEKKSAKGKAAGKESKPSHCPCADEGRPSSVGDEWKKIRGVLDKYF